MEKTVIQKQAGTPSTRRAAPDTGERISATQSVAAAIHQLNEAARKDAEALAIEKQRSESLSAELGKTLARLHEREAEFRIKEKSYEAQLQAVRMEVTSLQPARRALEKQELVLAETQQALENTTKDSQEKIKAAQAESAALRGEIQTLKNRIATGDREREAAKQAQAEFERRAQQETNLGKAFESLKTEHEKLAERFRAFHENAVMINGELKTALETALKDAATLRRERDHLRKSFLVADNAANALRSELKECRLKLAAAEPTILSQAKQMREMSTQLQFTRATAEKFTLDCRTLRENIVQLSDENTAMADELVHVKRQLQGVTEKARILDQASMRGTAEKVKLWETQKREIYDECSTALLRMNELRKSNPSQTDPRLKRPGIGVVEQLEILLQIANQQLLEAERSFEAIQHQVRAGASNPPPAPKPNRR